MGRTLKIEHARAYLPLQRPARYKGLYGGRGSAKSHEFAKMLIEDSLRIRGLRTVCVREVQRSLDQSVKQLIEDKLALYDLTHDGFRVLDTHIETPGDGIILFQGMQNHTSDSIKSLEGYHRAWVEEAHALSQRSLNLLTPTLRTSVYDPRTDKKEDPELWFSWNPDKEDDPVDKMLRGPLVPPNAIVIGTTFEDNPWFPDVLRTEMEWDRQTDPDKYAHVWLGMYQSQTESRVFKNWRIEEFTAPPNTSFLLGADWGFSVDPSSLVRAFESLVDWTTGNNWPRKRLYVDYDLYRVGVEIDHLPAFFDGLVCGCRIQKDGSPQPEPCRDRAQHGWARPWAIIADSARPETISYLRRYGYGGMEPAKKGANSVKEGVLFLQGYDIRIHPRCAHAIDEFTKYSYKVDQHTRKVLPILDDKKNHIIDPLRYAAEQLRGQVRMRKAVWG